MNRVEGLVAAPFTPMDDDGVLMTEKIPLYYNILKLNGIKAAFINGTTGEGPSLSVREKESVVQSWAKCFKEDGSVIIINMVGGTSYTECEESAIMSEEAGVSAISIIAPYFYKPADVGQLADFCTRIAEAVPRLPVFFYHFPGITGVRFQMSEFIEKAALQMPNFAGIKYTFEDLDDYRFCIEYMNGKYDILWGRDEMLLQALGKGAAGAVGSTYNYAAPLYYRIIGLFREGRIDEAGVLQKKAVQMIGLLEKYGGIGTGKAFMKYIGFDCGKYRMPVKNLTDRSYLSFVRDADALGLKNLFSVTGNA